MRVEKALRDLFSNIIGREALIVGLIHNLNASIITGVSLLTGHPPVPLGSFVCKDDSLSPPLAPCYFVPVNSDRQPTLYQFGVEEMRIISQKPFVCYEPEPDDAERQHITVITFHPSPNICIPSGMVFVVAGIFQGPWVYYDKECLVQDWWYDGYPHLFIAEALRPETRPSVIFVSVVGVPAPPWSSDMRGRLQTFANVQMMAQTREEIGLCYARKGCPRIPEPIPDDLKPFFEQLPVALHSTSGTECLEQNHDYHPNKIFQGFMQ